MLSGIIVYGIVYQFYVKWFDRSVVQSDPNRPTPAHTYLDGVEFFPSNKYVMLGWHWKSIAALGPVTGPALAIVWGWLPGFLWILIGNSLLGWLHDYNSMMTSVRSEGASLGPLTYQIIGKRARRVLVAFLAFYSILIFAAFLGALLPILKNQAFVGGSAIVAFIIIAVIGVASGYAIFKAKINVVAVTIASLVGVALTVYLSTAVFGSAIGTAFTSAIPDPQLQENVLLASMLVFSILGAVLPLWSFAMPINYLGFYVAYFVVGAIVASSFIAPQTFTSPMFTNWFSPVAIGAGTGLINNVAFPLWPLLFVTIACGACSGWHGLIGSSLSSKQLDSETDAHFVGGGSMLLEGILGLTSVVAVASLKIDFSQFLPGLGLYVNGGASYITRLGFASNVSSGIMGLMGLVLGLTLCQLALRFARLAIAESVGVKSFRNVYLTSVVGAIITYVLVSNRVTPTGFWGFIWALFGGSNQLLARVTLLVTTLCLSKLSKHSVFTGVPAVFMIVTTIAALAYTAVATFSIGFTASGVKAYGSGLAGVIATILTVLGLVLAYDGYKAYRGIKTGAAVTPTATPTRPAPAMASEIQIDAAEKSKVDNG